MHELRGGCSLDNGALCLVARLMFLSNSLPGGTRFLESGGSGKSCQRGDTRLYARDDIWIARSAVDAKMRNVTAAVPYRFTLLSSRDRAIRKFYRTRIYRNTGIIDKLFCSFFANFSDFWHNGRVT